MRVVHLSQSPVAGAAWAWSEAFKEAGYESVCIAPGQYSDGRLMPRDQDWPPDDHGKALIYGADLIFCHQGQPYKQLWYPKDKATVAIYHSQPTPGHTYRGAENDGWPWAAIGQWEARLYNNAWPVPNLVPLKHPWYQPGAKSRDYIRIAYSPSNRNRPGWDNKGYAETCAALSDIGAEIDVIEGVPLEECLKRKGAAHIVIDECVTGAYHRSSLEALAIGCVVVNACDRECEALIRRMTGGSMHPFVVCGIAGLRKQLERLITEGAAKLTAYGAEMRAWMECAWAPAELIERNFLPLMEKAIARARSDEGERPPICGVGGAVPPANLRVSVEEHH